MNQAFSLVRCSALVMSMLAPAALAQTTVGPGEVLPITISTAEDFEINGGTLAPTNVTLSGTIHLQSSSRIIRPQNSLVPDPRGNLREASTGPTNLNGPISGAGDLELGNASRDPLFVNGNNTYTGHSYITAGDIIATTSTAFGSPLGTTTIQGANVRVDAATDEQFRIEGGTLRFNAGDFVPSTPITIAGGQVYLPNRDLYQVPIVVDGAGGAIQFAFNEAASWTGGSTGTGSLRLVGRIGVDAPLTHDGDLVIDGVRLNVPNTYTGKTIIADNYVIDRADVFGTATSPIEIDDAGVTVQVLPNGDRGFALKRGTLDVQTSAPINAGVTLGGGFEAVLRGVGTFNAPVDYVTVPGGGNAYIQGGTFNGPIRGNTLLRLGGDDGVTLNAANDIQGLVHVTEGTVIVNHVNALPLPATLIQGGVIELNTVANGLPMLQRYPYGSQQTGTLRLNVDQHFDGHSHLNLGTVESTADIRFDRLITHSAEITSAEQGSVTINGELLVLGSAKISGTIKGNGTIRVVGINLSASGDLSEFNGDLVVENGTLAIVAPTPLGSGDIFVRGAGTLDFGGYFSPARVVDNTIFLHNEYSPIPGSAGLAYSEYGGGPLTIAGRLDVGEHGGTIRGSNGIYITGSITGHSLQLVDSSIAIESRQEQLDVLKIVDSSISIGNEGGLHGLDSIHIQNGGALRITSNDSGSIDRIDESTPIHSYGGRIEVFHHLHFTGSETLGTLHLDRGFTEILGRPESPVRLVNIQRERGSLLRFSEHAGQGGVGFVNRPTLPNGMLGPWATTDSGFATLDASNTFRSVQPTASNLNTAGPDDHVAVQGGQTLTGDRVVASLNNPPTGSPYSLDLNGHKLTVRSGGIYSSGDIVNGILTAGDGQPAELIIYQTRRIDANIVDNGPNGSVALVVADEFGLPLSGVNTYTGGTWVVGDSSPYYADRARLIIESLEAIPSNDRVHVEFGHYDIRLAEPSIVDLAELHIRNDGYVTGANARIDADVYHFEHGLLNAPLVGNGTIYKDSSQTFEFGNDSDSSEFAGNLYLRDGLLRLERESIPNASIFVEGGWLDAGGQFSGVNNDIVLDGGQLEGYFGGAIHVASDSTLYHNGDTLLRGSLSGGSDLTIRGTRSDDYVGIFGDASQYTGDFHVPSGALRIGALAQLGAGEIYVHEGGQLILGSDRTGDGQTIVDRDIHINHGTVYFAPPTGFSEFNGSNGVITGNAYVHDVAFFGANGYGVLNGQRGPGLVFAGGVVLDDGATVFGRTRSNAVFFADEVPLIEIAGHLDVGTDNVWNLELAALSVTGTIRAGAPDASIDFQGLPSLLRIDQASIFAEAGRAISITVNGAPRDVHLSTSEAGLAGDGAIHGNFDLSDGATIAPGSSPGSLTIAGDLQLGSGAVYEWEIENQAAGAGAGWDLLNVDGILTFTATSEAPWILAINELENVLAFRGSEWLIASATTINGFDPTCVQVLTDNVSDTFQRSRTDQFSIEMRGTDLYLVLTVPEPASATYIALLCLILLAYKGTRHR